MNTDLYADLTTRLKYATPPTVKNMVATDQEIDAILRDVNLPLREKHRILSDALYRLQLYKSMIDSESFADSIVGPNATAASSPMDVGAVNRLAPYSSQPARRRQQWDSYRLVIQSSPHQFDQSTPHFFVGPTSATRSATAKTSPQQQQLHQVSPTGPLSSSAFQRQLAEGDDDDDGDLQQQFATPLSVVPPSTSTSASVDRTGSVSDMDAAILQMAPQNYQQQALQFLKAIEILPEDIIRVDPTSLQVVVRGRSTIHIVDALKQMANTLPTGKSAMPIAGLQNVVGLLARQSNLPTSVIRSPRIREYFLESRVAALDQQPSTSHARYSRPRQHQQQQQRGMPGDPTVYRNWHDVNQLP